MNISDAGPRFGSTNLATAMIRVAMMLAALSALLVVATLSALAQNETVLYSFGSQSGDGIYPGCCLVLDKQSNLYGTTNWGGAYGYGTVFKLTATGDETVLYSFGVANIVPSPGGLTSDKRGTLYGTTIGGGANDEGTVFKLTPNGAVTVLHSFGSQSGDGIYPGWGLVLDKRGNLYGTTGSGGAYGYGTVFRLTATGDETVLYSFGGQAGDFNPGLDLVLDKQGNLYGTTGSGGAYNFGTVFKLTPTGVETVLHSFGQYGDGRGPESRLVLDKQGNLYGTTGSGGAYGYGTVFKLTPAGDETVLHVFGSQYGDGIYPIWNLVSDKQGNIYGTTSRGGANGYGTVFRLTP